MKGEKKVIINGKAITYKPSFTSHEIPHSKRARFFGVHGLRPIQIKRLGDDYEVTVRNRDNNVVKISGKLSQVIPFEFRELVKVGNK